MGPRYNIKIMYMDGTIDILIGDIGATSESLFTFREETGKIYIYVPLCNIKSVTLEEII